MIPYTTYPMNESADGDMVEWFRNQSLKIKMKAEDCSEPDLITMGTCYLLVPRCLMGYQLSLCNWTCAGEIIRAMPALL